MQKFVFILLFILPYMAFSNELKVLKTRGPVFYKEAENSDWTKLNKSTPLQFGFRIKTEKKGFILIKLPNKGTLATSQNSEIILTDYKNKTASLSLLKGYVRSQYDKSVQSSKKLIIKTRSVVLGIRGTDFGLIYNPDNNISSAISFEGNVELAANNSNITRNIKARNFSTFNLDQDEITEASKLSPKQFNALKENKDHIVSDKKRVISNKKIKAITKNEEQSLPQQLLGPGFGQMYDIYENDPLLMRPGGYLDLNSALYIEPPKDATFDSENGVFNVPKELGGFDQKTGEYVPPLGIILHPLKGFTIASDLLAETSKFVREKTLGVSKKVFDGVKNTGSKLTDGAIYIGETLENNTGFVGKAVGSGVKMVKNTTVDTVKNTSHHISENTVESLDFLADKLNNYFNNGYFKESANRISKLPYLNQLDIQLTNKFVFTDTHYFSIYEQIDHVIKTESFRNEFKLALQFKKNFYNKVFVRPRAFISRIDYYSEDKAFQGYENYHHRYGIDIGAMGYFKGRKIQSYFFFDSGNFFKEEDMKGRYNEYLTDKRFGFSKLIIGKQYISSKLLYYYTEYDSKNFNSGHSNHFVLSEILNIDNKNYIDLTLNWSERKRKELNKDAKAKGIKLTYLFASKKNGFNVSLWGDYQEFTDSKVSSARGVEERKDLGFKFTKSFDQFFSTSFDIYNSTYKSESLAFDNNSTVFTLAFSGSY